jgi:outer membrane cobalamin receptor
LRFAARILAIPIALGMLYPISSLADESELEVEATSGDVEMDRLVSSADEEMVVSASRSPRRRTSVPSFSTVLEGADLESSVSTGLADALRFAPGLQLTQDGARGGHASIALRGLDPNHVVVLVDGVRLNDPTNQRGGSFDPTTLALLQIDRVEVIRGSLSSIYGSDALAGVINVITREAGVDDAPTAFVRARGGRFHAGDVVAEASAGLAGVAGLSLGAAYDTFRDPNSDGGYDGLSWKAKLNMELPFSIDLEAFTRMNRSSFRSFPESSGGPELAGLRDLEDRDVREILFGLSLERPLGSSGLLGLRLSRSSRREDLESPGIDPAPGDPGNPNVVPPSNAGDEYERWDLTLDTSWRLPSFEIARVESRTRITGGVDFVWEDGESDTYHDFGGGSMRFPFFEDRETIGFFAEIEETLGPWVVASAAVRYDTTPDENDRLSPSAGLTVDIPSTSLTLFGSYGEGFKRPSFFALGNPIVGNRSLRSEKSRGWEVGLRGHAFDGRVSAQLSYFDLEVDDLIDFDNSGFVPRLVNRDRLISRGVELEVDWKAFDHLVWRGGVTYNPTDFDGTSLQPQNRSRWRGFSELRLEPVRTFEIGLRLLLVGSMKASSLHTGCRVVTLNGYERIDLRVGWQPRDWIELSFEIENLTDRTYREAVGFEAPGIGPRVGVTLRL